MKEPSEGGEFPIPRQTRVGLDALTLLTDTRDRICQSRIGDYV